MSNNKTLSSITRLTAAQMKLKYSNFAKKYEAAMNNDELFNEQLFNEQLFNEQVEAPTASEMKLKYSKFTKMYEAAMNTDEGGAFNEALDSHDQEEAQFSTKYAPNMLPSGDSNHDYDPDSYSEKDLESLGLKDAKTDDEVEAEDGEVEVTPEEQSKFSKMFKAAMQNLKSEDGEAGEGEGSADKTLRDKMETIEDKELLSNLDRAKDEDEEDADKVCDSCEPCEHTEDEECDCECDCECDTEDIEDTEDEDAVDEDEEVVAEENAFDKIFRKVNVNRIQKESRRKGGSVGAILGAAEQGEKVGPDGKAIPKEDSEDEDVEKHEDRTHTPDDLYGKEGAAYKLDGSEVDTEDFDDAEWDWEDEDDDEKKDDVVEEGSVSQYMSNVAWLDSVMDAPADEALVEESTTDHSYENISLTEEKVVVESYAGGFAKTLK